MTTPPRGLLAIFAHPDDESFGAGGVLALAAAAGEPAWVLCATNGDQGGRPGEMGVDHSMDPEIRREELACACRELGVNEPIFLGYRDSGMEGWGALEGALSLADPEEAVDRIVEVIERLRPATIVTFDPGGAYGHPDHVAVSRFATDAYWRTSGQPGGPVALYHNAIARSRAEEMSRRMAEEREKATGEPPSEDDLRQEEAFVRLARPDEEVTTFVRIGDVFERKMAALACHDSQMRGRDFNDPTAREEAQQMFGVETFVRIDPAPVQGEREDRLQGIDGEAAR